MEGKCYTDDRNNKYYILKQDDKKLKIMFGGTLDLYIQLINPDLKEEELGYDTFEITKDNYYIYSLFDELYNDIETCNIYDVDELDLMFCETEEEVKKVYESKKKLNEEEKNTIKYKNIFDGKSIIWYSDEYMHDKTDILKITKDEDKYVLEFQEQSLNKDTFAMRYQGLITIRLRNSGSYQEPFNILFMRMYQKLLKYEPNYHQIHIEEYAYQKKIGKIKASDNN